MKKQIVSLLLCLLVIAALTTPALSHSGRTDSDGGHWNHSTGEYHYHHGYPAHQHTGGVCPYDYEDKAGQNSESSSNNSNNSGGSNGNKVTDNSSSHSEDNKASSKSDRASGLRGILLGAVIIFSPGLILGTIGAIKEKTRKKKEEKEFLRLKAKYEHMYGGKRLDELVNIPDGVEIGEDGLPKEIGADGWGEQFTFFVKNNYHMHSYKQVFHKKRGCSSAFYKVHAYHIGNRAPCLRCSPRRPNLEWYEEYLRIKRIKETYGID